MKLGSLTEQEIDSQPGSWDKALQICQRNATGWKTWLDNSRPVTWFVGCGTSFYLATAAAAAHRALTGQEAASLPASELLLFPELYLASSRPARCVLISRSGSTTEIIRLAERLRDHREIECVAITCREDRPLASLIPRTVIFPHAFDHSVVMTSSFSTMLLGLVALSCLAAEQPHRLERMRGLAEAGHRILQSFPPLAASLAASAYQQFVFLGQGPLFGIAQEASLKMKEMSISCSEPFHSLEERHGPKSVVDARTLVTVFSSEQSEAVEADLLGEVRGLGSDTLQIAACGATPQPGSYRVGLDSSLDLYERLPLYILPAQRLALALARAKDINCDQPQALSAVVEFALPATGL